jgi:hypothetical protein
MLTEEVCLNPGDGTAKLTEKRRTGRMTWSEVFENWMKRDEGMQDAPFRAIPRLYRKMRLDTKACVTNIASEPQPFHSLKV